MCVVLTDYDHRDVANQLPKARVGNMLEEKLQDRLQQNIIATSKCYSQSISVDKFLDQCKCRGRWHLLETSSAFTPGQTQGPYLSKHRIKCGRILEPLQQFVVLA